VAHRERYAAGFDLALTRVRYLVIRQTGTAQVIAQGRLDTKSLYGWAVLATFLFVMSDFEATSDLAAAFAWLVLIAVFLLYGANMFSRIVNALAPTKG